MELNKLKSEGTDTSLQLLKEKLVSDDFSISRHFSSRLNAAFLKVCERGCGGYNFITPIFLVIYQVDNCIKTALLTYNEESLEELDFTLRMAEDIEEVYNYVKDRMNSLNLTLCPGLNESSVINLNLKLKEVCIEKYGSTISYRSRDCIRAAEKAEGDLCVNCSAWIHKLSDKVSQLHKPQTKNHPGCLPAWIETESVLPDDDGEFFSPDENEGVRLINAKLRQKKKWPCPNCDESFELRPDMTSHLDICAPNLCACDQCDTISKSEEELSEHFKTQHADSNGGKSFNGRDKKCPMCRQRFKNNQNLYKHMQLCMPSHKFFTCDQCELLFTSEMHLKQHVYKHDSSGGIYPCPTDNCAKMFKIHLGKTMRNHLEYVHNIDPDNPPNDLKEKFESVSNDVPRLGGRRAYPCTVEGCSYVGKDITALRYHQPVHTGETMFCCTTCGKKFKYKKELLLCEKRHNGEYNFFCSNCEKRFLSKKKLDLHLRVHTGEKPYSCPVCNFRCARKDNLNTHTKKHHGVGLRELEQHGGDDQKLPATDELKPNIPIQIYNIVYG